MFSSKNYQFLKESYHGRYPESISLTLLINIHRTSILQSLAFCAYGCDLHNIRRIYNLRINFKKTERHTDNVRE